MSFCLFSLGRYTQLTQSVAVYPLLQAMSDEEHHLREAAAGLAAQRVRDQQQQSGAPLELPPGWQMHNDPK